MRLHIVYRSYGGENMKRRPDYYSKRLSLLSFLRARQDVEAEVIFLNDGPIPDERLSLMQMHGEIVRLPSVGMRGSYVRALRLPQQRSWPETDLVYFSEDDYLYAPPALQYLMRAANAVSQADYFAVYGSTPRFPVYPQAEHEAAYPRGWQHRQPILVHDWTWVPIISHTSTFAARIKALREDMNIFRQCMLPMRNSLFDHETCVVYQGYEPFDRRGTLRALCLAGPGLLRERARETALAPFKLALNLRSHRRTTRRRILLGAEPNLATHAELPHLAPGVDWQQVAQETVKWAAARGHVSRA